MSNNEYYPSLSGLISLDKLPGEFSFENTFLDKIFYKNLRVFKSKDGEKASYYIEVISADLRISLLDSDLELIINPDATNTNFSVIPIELFYRLEIIKYIKQFNPSEFGFDITAYFDLILDMLGVSLDTLLEEAISVFIDDIDPIQKFITDYNNFSGNVLTLTSTSDFQVLYAELVANTVDVIKMIFDFFVENHSDSARALKELFNRWLGSFSVSRLKELITPEFSISLKSMELALAFPRNWVKPVDLMGNVIPQGKSLLSYNVGSLNYSLSKGLDFQNVGALNFTRSQIGETGIIIDLQNLKIDLRKDRNIPEADADGRPEDFQGVYCERATVTLPPKWFKNQTPGLTAEVFGNNLLIGTGGISGTLGLEAVGGNDILWANIGSNDGFRVGFESFDIQFKQNKVLSSSIKGAMEIKKFVYPDGTVDGNGVSIAGQIVTIGIEGHIHDDGDFNLTASTAPPYPIEFPDVFIYHIKSLELGSEDDDFYVGTSGKLEFQGFLKDTLKLKAIDIDRLRIYSDGTIEFQGGSIALVEPIVLALGPVEITVSAIHYGSHQREIDGVMRKFNYFGFDGGISVDPLGIEVRGDGVKFYYCTDNLPNKPSSYLHIQTLYLDLTIPSSTPAAIINGWLSIPEPGESKEYAGGIKLQLPQAKIAGSADMKLQPRYPAFIIDASIDLPAPIPVGPVGIYGFRGLIGYRYVAEKEAAGLVSGVDSWYDYYKTPPRGIHVTKFNEPDRTVSAGTPFSIGAGASLGTSFDNGTVLNIKAMLLLSIPSLFMIDGRAAVLSARLGLDDSGDPPFFAFIAIGDNSLELGFGADFKIPSDTGEIVELYADVQAGFFFNDSSKWYVNIGTKQNPITARVVTLMTLTSYIMMSAKGIEGGARGEFNFFREYGPIKVHAWAYIEVGGKISFEKPQFGAYLAAGVGADIDIKIVSLYASFNILFGVEAPKPFLIYGEFHYCVKISILWVFKFKFCGELAVSWEFNSSVDRSPFNPMINPNNTGMLGDKVKGVSMLSNETFDLAYLGANAPAGLPTNIRETIIPIDTYIDIKTEKGLVAQAVSSIIGGVNNPPKNYFENVPPQKVVKGNTLRQVKHEYSVESIEIKSWNPTSNSWEDYNPYEALYPSDPTLNTLKIGQFQKTDGQYSTIRILATNPFSYTEQGQPGWYVPEQNGITAGYLFCEGEREVEECADFLTKPLDQKYYTYTENDLFFSNEVGFFLYNKSEYEFGIITNEINSFGFVQSLRFNNTNTLQIRLPEESVEASLKLTTFSQGVKIRYYAPLIDDTTSLVTFGNPDPTAPNQNEPYEIYVPASALNSPVIYDQPNWRAITRIEVLPQYANSVQIAQLQEQIATINNNNFLISIGLKEGKIIDTSGLEGELEDLKQIGCQLANGEDSKEPVEGCNPAKLCELYDNLIAIQPHFIVSKVQDWRPIEDCAHQMLDLILQFDKLNPRCLIRQRFRAFIRVIQTFLSDANYRTLEQLRNGLSEVLAYLNANAKCSADCEKDEYYCDLWEQIFEIRNNCLPHPTQISEGEIEAYSQCFGQILELVLSVKDPECRLELRLKSGPIFHYISKPGLSEYETAWNAVNLDLDCISDKGSCDCQDDDAQCHTLLHEVCWLSLESYRFNEFIPGQAAIEADALAAVNGITQYIQPVWRPDTNYYVRFVLRDLVDAGTSQENGTNFPFVYGFSTAGPLGYFHTHENATYGDYIDPNTNNIIEDANGIVRNSSGTIIPQTPPLTPHPEKYALTTLRQYIDYQRSYPNADGNLLSAKPLFYDDETTRIDIFFAKAWATHFFQNWQAYNGKSSVDGRIKIVIKDPREGDTIVNPPYLDYDPADTIHVNTPQTIESWQDDPNPQVPHIFDQFANLMAENDCITIGGNTIIPKSSYLQVIPKHLKPRKLYTAIVNNLYDLNGNGTFEEANNEIREVHKFTFQTSRYASFKEQVNSYILTNGDALDLVTNKAVFSLEKGFTTTEIQAAYDTIVGTSNPLSNSLVTDYQHAYDRVFEGILGFNPLDEAISTEFNVVKDTNDGNKIVAIVIRNPEPFNNPRLPISEVIDTLQVLNNAGVPDNNFKILFSKDYSQAIIMRSGLSISSGMYDFKFSYKIWNGSTYIVPATPQYSTDEVGTILVNDIEII